MARIARYALVSSVVLASGQALFACADEVKHVGGEPIPGPDQLGGDTDTTPGPAEPDAGPAEPDGGVKLRQLAFEDAFGDDQVPCTGTDSCSYIVSFTEKRKLKVVYTEDGVPAEGELVTFEVVTDDKGIAKLTAFNAYTDAEGKTYVEASASNSVIADFEVMAYVGHEGVPPLTFKVTVVPKGVVPLTVLATYGGSSPEVASFRAQLYKQDEAGLPNCADLETLYEDSASLTSALTNLPQSVKFKELPKLEEEGTQKYTVLAFAKDAQDKHVLAWGCDDQKGEVTWGLSTTVDVVMMDRPPRYAGTYEVETLFNLVSALPPPFDGYVEIVLDVFKSPVGGLLSLACDLGGEFPVLKDMCELVFSDPTDPSVDTLSGTGALVVDILDAILQGFAKGTVFGDILVGGKDISEMLTAFHVTGTLVVTVEPDFEGAGETLVGHWGEGDLEETWDGVTVKWSLGQNCDPLTDENCGKQSFNLTKIQDTPAFSASFTAHVEGFWDLTIDLHPLDFKYGVLLDFLLQNIALPLLAGEDPTAGPLINSYDKFIASLVGGSDCVAASGASYISGCCESFTQGVVSGGASTTADIIQAMCETLVEAGDSLLEDQLQGLSTGTGDTFMIGTLESCKLYDSDKDQVVDAMGKKGKPCSWDVQVSVFGAETTVDAIFWATRAD